ncbi:RNase adapter RapZ [Sutterella sp.]|uniref:RNase adapter RapZ n=1 Tax=Sutterella sp. TaxID=1981025 RepID=UPI0026DFA356|nr:RNase adapter RapZ [Sutterella sp.]MDO5530709.1 RNase adapter RapZ [Sutterella sp.]
MQLIIVTGLSGGGKSIAIRQLEDSGYYCIDNLPAEFLVPVAESLEKTGVNTAAVAIDARSLVLFKSSVTETLDALRARGVDARVLFLTASNTELVKRFSETRRRHPLSALAEKDDQELTIDDAIAHERSILEPLAQVSHVMDTTRLLPSQLRRWVQQFAGEPEAKLTLTFESFGFKRGLPFASDLVFDVRCLPNPYYYPEMRHLTGLDQPVADYLAGQPLVTEMVNDIIAFVEKWLPRYTAQNRHYLTVCIGCTGGQHRSVYVAEQLAKHFASRSGTIVRHRALESVTPAEGKIQTV